MTLSLRQYENHRGGADIGLADKKPDSGRTRVPLACRSTPSAQAQIKFAGFARQHKQVRPFFRSTRLGTYPIITVPLDRAARDKAH